MSKEHEGQLMEALPDMIADNAAERRLFKSQMLGFVLLPVAGMALLGVVIVMIELF